MFKNKELEELRTRADEQDQTINFLHEEIRKLSEKINQIEGELHPKYFGGK